VPLVPTSPFLSRAAKPNPYPYDPAKSKALLSAHGWTVVPGGTDTCARPGSGPDQCGAGISAGDKLDFDLEYTTGVSTMAQALAMERSAWASAGIHVNLSTAPFQTVIGNAVACPSGPSCTWQLEYWGAGWQYSPDVYPTGEQLFSTGAGSNYGSYSDPTNDQNVVVTTTTNATLFGYEDYLAKQLPVIWQPTEVQYLWEIDNRLRGAAPVNALQNADPEYYYFVK
jgi:peptide/nickel transport system substrate-binding protein